MLIYSNLFHNMKCSVTARDEAQSRRLAKKSTIDAAENQLFGVFPFPLMILVPWILWSVWMVKTCCRENTVSGVCSGFAGIYLEFFMLFFYTNKIKYAPLVINSAGPFLQSCQLPLCCFHAGAGFIWCFSVVAKSNPEDTKCHLLYFMMFIGHFTAVARLLETLTLWAQIPPVQSHPEVWLVSNRSLS